MKSFSLSFNLFVLFNILQALPLAADHCAEKEIQAGRPQVHHAWNLSNLDGKFDVAFSFKAVEPWDAEESDMYEDEVAPSVGFVSLAATDEGEVFVAHGMDWEDFGNPKEAVSEGDEESRSDEQDDSEQEDES